MSDVNAEKAVQAGWSKPVPVSYNKRDLILYALATGSSDLRYVFENHDNFAALPWYPVVSCFKGTSSDVVSFPSDSMQDLSSHADGLPVPAGAVLDGERYLELINPLPLDGTNLALKGRVLGVFDKQTGATVEQEQILFNTQTNMQYCRIISASFYVGVTGFKSAGTSNSIKLTTPKRSPDAVVEQQTNALSATLYRLSGDYNALHIDPEMAQALGFKAPILHGLCSFGHSARHVLATFGGNDAKNFKAIRVRFSSPVMPGQTLVTKMWKDDQTANRIVFEVSVKETGKICMSNCYMDLTNAVENTHKAQAKL
jgi:3-hydroxyacyl-CoA dehydrogenase/3a,7a,12a-trihydroxy-5b-cholest-24-enoyl-CoA hydratase